MEKIKPRCEILKFLAKLNSTGKNICLICKGGRMLCGRKYCPLIQITQIRKPVEVKLKKDIFGPSPPSLFVGFSGYPDVFIGPMTSLDENIKPKLLDNPKEWYGLDFNDIIRMRAFLVRSKIKHNVTEKSKFLENIQELILSIKSVDIELKFKKKPKYSLSFSPFLQPMGPTGVLENFSLTENPKIPKKVDRIVSDELKTNESVYILYKKGYDVYYLSKILSAGILGMNKRIVPTRWSITATDDIIAKELLKEVRTYPKINEFLVYSNTYLDNHFEILFIPGYWSFEQFEAWAPKTLWTIANQKPVITVESEGFFGRNKYAIKEGGGYYAGKLAVVEHLYKIKRQATVIIFREIYDTYIIPVGVWEVRENVRNALKKTPERFDDLNSALKFISKKLTIPLNEFIKRSVFLSQRNLYEFLRWGRCSQRSL